ncbi:cobyric acid synthase [Halobaculum sp. WSA2]|uniref:Probable cobyric acid synthase n=1 Tax=Halobaculum saliterrae TaxID=2073113 RepID=A0A6B0STK3_9EURY|nr:cobyric acid synthase [Halobaculum saliterrae]MXR41877.1 cobyric acid synthase [Halobaculum saliterrae]
MREGDRGSDVDAAATLLVAGTASHVGKSTVVAGLCRRLADAGVSVAPFKAQNMSNNARAALRPDGDWGEIGVSQFVQARAAGITPTTDTNPVLLKPRGGGESQLVIDGEAVGHYEAGTYYDEHWGTARTAAREAYDRLAAEHDVVVAEGAGSIAEINLHDRDLANVETARFGDASILLLGDIERGGVFASLYGTLELMPDDLRERVAATAITKFRGDASLLDPGIEELEARTGVPVAAVLPYDDPGLPEEDSVALPDGDTRTVVGDDDGVADAAAVTVAVPRLPRVSNFSDLDPLTRTPGVRVAYVPLDADLADADAVVLPGTKNTVDDLLALRDAGFDERLQAFDGPVVGVCGGYQMLGERITNAAVEGTGDADEVAGVGLLPVETRFREDKRVRETVVSVDGAGPLAGVSGTVSGYEIHMGRTEPVDGGAVETPLEPGSAAVGDVLGTYLHDVFATESVREAFVDALFSHTGRERPTEHGPERDPYEAAAALVADLDVSALLGDDAHAASEPNADR